MGNSVVQMITCISLYTGQGGLLELEKRSGILNTRCSFLELNYTRLVQLGQSWAAYSSLEFQLFCYFRRYPEKTKFKKVFNFLTYLTTEFKINNTLSLFSSSTTWRCI